GGGARGRPGRTRSRRRHRRPQPTPGIARDTPPVRAARRHGGDRPAPAPATPGTAPTRPPPASPPDSPPARAARRYARPPRSGRRPAPAARSARASRRRRRVGSSGSWYLLRRPEAADRTQLALHGLLDAAQPQGDLPVGQALHLPQGHRAQ